MAVVRFAASALSILTLAPALARGGPLDVTNPMPRPIRVQFEISANPATVGQVFSQAYPATYSATGNTGTVVISQAVYESAIATHALDWFDHMTVWSLVGGSASDFTLEIDLTTLEATAHPLGYQVSITSPVSQSGTVTRDLSTTALAGFAYLPQYPGFPFFCDTCSIVPGAPYDPVTGKLNAVGRDRLVAPDFTLNGITRSGDLRLSEDPPPAVPALSRSAQLALALALLALAAWKLRGARA